MGQRPVEWAAIGVSKDMNVAQLIPEWPQHGQLWFWREVCWLRKWGLKVTLFSTRRPLPRDRARHAFADQDDAQAVYLWPMGLWRAMWICLACLVRHPLGFLRCIGLAFDLEVDARPRWLHVLPLLVPACALTREARRRGIEHIHCHSAAKGAILCMMAHWLGGIPFSLIVNANIDWWGGAMRQKFADASFVMLVSHRMMEAAARQFPGVAAQRCVLGRVGVDVDKGVPPAGGRDNRLGQSLGILSVSRLVKSKGQDVLLRAAALLKDAGVLRTLRIGGMGPEMEALKTLAAELGLNEQVTFLGPLDEDQYLREMHQADVFVLASHAEPMGVVYMEAMATEIATVGTDAGGVPELIANEQNGLLVKPNDPAALAAALMRLAADREFRQRLGRAARRRVVEEFDSRIWAAKLYERLTGTKPPA